MTRLDDICADCEWLRFLDCTERGSADRLGCPIVREKKEDEDEVQESVHDQSE